MMVKARVSEGESWSKKKLVRIWEVVKEKNSKERVSQRQSKERVSKEPVRRERVSQRNCSLTVNGIASCAGGGVADLLLKEVSQEMRFERYPIHESLCFSMDCKWGATSVSCFCGRQNSIVICDCRIVCGQVADGIALLFATLGPFP